MNTLRHLGAIIALPFTVTIIVPVVILSASNSTIDVRFDTPFNAIRIFVGVILIAIGLALMVKTISLFATVGKGTLAPWDPPKHLVVRGIYSYVRNPMISGVFAILLGESILFGSLSLLIWFFAFVLANAIFTPLVEERDLARRFGNEYLLYKQNVPRWIPRFKAWKPQFGD